MRPETQTMRSPSKKRWQPLRSGLVNLYRYDREEFHYENGRLLLRGNNGTGKSRILALQLPFLFDGEVSPQRLEPDADPSKRVEWNLLMGRYPDRTGYTWIEFGRSDEEGEHYLTLGCGLSAVEGQAGVRQWFFITSQRIGSNLDLVSDSKQVLGKDRLREKIGSNGQVFDAAGAYRRAVNEALFHLDGHRYASLVNLLIQLRRPQLTRRLEEHELSRALSEAMPPVSRAVIENVAEAFSNLQSDRSALDSSKAALSAVEQFLTVYRSYAEIAAKRRADRVLAAHEKYEAGMKEILTAEAECDRSLAELARLKTEMERLSVEEHALETEITAFQQGRQGTQTNDAYTLEQLHREANERRKDARYAAAELDDASRGRKAAEEGHVRFRTKMEQRKARLATAVDGAARAALSAGVESTHRGLFEALDLHAADEAALKQSRDAIDTCIQTQIEKTERAAKFNARLSFARNEVQRAGTEKDQITGLLNDARERLNKARADHQSAISSFLGAVSDWTAALTELPLPFDETFLGSVRAWCERPHGPNPFAVASRQALDELIQDFAEKRAYLKQLEKTCTEELAQVEADHERRPSIEARLDPILESLDELNRRESTLRGEAGATPPDDSVRNAYDYASAVWRHLDSVRGRIAEAEQSVTQKQQQAAEITEQRDRVVADLGIANWIDDLDALKEGIALYRLALSSLWAAVDSFQDAQGATERAWAQVEQEVARETRQKEIANRLERQAVAAEIARDAASQRAGASFAEILARVNHARKRVESLRVEEKEIRGRYHDTEVAVTRVDERLRNRTEMLNGQTDRRETAAVALRTFAATGLLDLAAADVDAKSLASSMTRTVEAAFELSSRLDSIDADDPAWERHQKLVPSEFTALMQALSAQNCQSSATFRDDVFVATAVFGGQERSMAELRQTLSDDVATRQRLLDARQREILENHLIGSVSSHLRNLLHAAEEQVREMNVELESRPMSTGMKLRFVWRLAEDAPPGMAEARQRLMQFTDAWSPADRHMLGAFLQQQIQAVCSDFEGASWQESLAEALDYRKWHQFVVERYQDGVWKRLTQRTYGTGSGGEKAVALTLPHFAAAAAFYRTASPQAPRLILLDEAFVGIDADMRAKCMGLIDTFDLDFMMTSEREWACYPTLPGVAIYQLSTRPGIDAVGLTRWVWNGRQRSLPRATAEEAQKSQDQSAYRASV
jgi:SbcC/RAD50-like, Walker B motif